MLDEEQRTLVLRALDALAPDQKAALVLVDMQGYSVEEAAMILGCAPGTVKSRCSRGRARLVPLLTELRPRAVQETDAGTAGHAVEPPGASGRPSTGPLGGGEQA